MWCRGSRRLVEERELMVEDVEKLYLFYFVNFKIIMHIVVWFQTVTTCN